MVPWCLKNSGQSTDTWLGDEDVRVRRHEPDARYYCEAKFIVFYLAECAEIVCEYAIRQRSAFFAPQPRIRT